AGHRGEAARGRDLRLPSVGAGPPPDQVGDQLRRRAPGVRVEDVHRAGQLAPDRYRVVDVTGHTGTPHETDAGSRVGTPVQQRRYVHDHAPERVHQIHGQVRAGGVPARPGERDTHPV